MKTELEKLIEKWESEKGSYIPNAPIYQAFIDEAKEALKREKQRQSEQLVCYKKCGKTEPYNDICLNCGSSINDDTPMAVRCENCGWEGYDDELVKNDEFSNESYMCCPTCSSERIE